MNLLKFSLLRFLLPLLLPFSLQAAVFYVDGQAGRDAGPGSKSRPFKSITKALSRLHKGDTLILKRGVYTRPLHNIPSGSRLKPTVIRAADGHHVEIRYPQKALRIDGDHIEIHGIVFNGLYGAAPVADINGSHLLISACEFKNSSRDIMTIGDVGDITIRNSSLHHGLSWYKKTGKEPHGISTDGVRGLTIRNCDIYQITGDAIQISPSRRDWDNVRIEDCRLWVAPLSATEVEASGLPARAVGMILAENAIDTKARKTDDPGRHNIRFKNITAHGFRSHRIKNAAAFNIKNPVTAHIEGVTVYDSEIAFRLRAPARVTLANALIYDCDVGVRYEGRPERLFLFNNTFGLNLKQALKAVAGTPVDFRVINNLFLTRRLPKALRGKALFSRQNRTVPPSLWPDTFIDAPAGDYRLKENSLPVDSGRDISGLGITDDRRGAKRPAGVGWDMGAFEYPATNPGNKQP